MILLQALGAARERATSEEEFWALTTRTAEALGDDPDLWEEFYAIVAMHPSTAVRLAGLDRASAALGSTSARTDLVCWLIHDPNDVVAMVAAYIASRQTLSAAVPELFAALGNSRATLHRLVYARTDLRQDLMASALATLLENANDRSAVVQSLLQVGYDRGQEMSHVDLNAEGMVAIPGEELFVDVTPVTVSKYDEFLRAVERSGHAYCHWGEPRSYDHRPHRASLRTVTDRSGVVTGVSWFDAFAFARWSGKRLPTSAQWQLAIERGCVSVAHDSTHDVSPLVEASLDELYERLRQLLQQHAGEIEPTARWEWTGSRHLDGADLSPFVGRRDYFETIGDWTMYGVVKGGMVLSSLARPKSSYEGRKHVLHKSPEITFRCVADRRDQ